MTNRALILLKKAARKDRKIARKAGDLAYLQKLKDKLQCAIATAQIIGQNANNI